MYSSSENVVRKTTRAPGSSAKILFAAHIPSLPGIWMSRSATSGRASCQRRSASAPHDPMPQTSMPSWAPRIILSESQTSLSSSATMTLMP